MLAWGRNDSGQLGVGDVDNRQTPTRVLSSSTFKSVACGSRTTLGVSLNGSLLGFGSAVAKVLGEDVEDDAVVIPRALEGLESVESVATRGAHAVALDAEGRVFTWGRGEQDYQRVTRPVMLPFKGVFIRKVGAGRMHSVAVDDAGVLFTWGSSDEGQTGLNRSGFVAQPTAVPDLPGPVTRVSCGSRHTLIIVTGSHQCVMGFGGNSYSQLGLGDREPRFVPSTIDCGNAMEQDADWDVACGYRHSFVYSKQSLSGFGWNSNHQVCPSPSGVINTPEPVDVYSRSGVRGEWADMHIVQVAAGGRHTLVLLKDDSSGVYSLVAFGRSVSGELGIPKFVETACREPLLVLTLSRPNTGMKPTVACGWEHSVIALAGSKVTAPSFSYSWLTSIKGDIDACLAQFVNCVVLLRLVPEEARMGVGKTVALSNLIFAAWGYRVNATALPHGLNTVALFAIQMGAYETTLARFPNDPQKALNSCFFCTLVLGLAQAVSAFALAPLLKRFVPRSALAASVAGVALAFITTRFTADIFTSAKAGLASLMVLLIGFGAKVRMPLGIPVAFVALFIGWILSDASEPPERLMTSVNEAQGAASWLKIVSDTDHFPFLLTVVLPLLVVNVVNDLACIEQARASGDLYTGRTGLLLDSFMTLIGALVFGSPFPTCIYVGHSSFKGMGATSAYSALNALLLLGLVFGVPSQFVLAVEGVPQVATVGFLVWIGAVVTTEAFKTKRHGVAVAIALVPALASWRVGAQHQTDSPGLRTLSEGYMLVSMILGAVVAQIIDRRFTEASLWLLFAASLASLGWIHGQQGFEVAKGYLAASAVTGAWAVAQWREGEREADLDEDNDRAEPHPIVTAGRPTTRLSAMNVLPPVVVVAKAPGETPVLSRVHGAYGAVGEREDDRDSETDA